MALLTNVNVKSSHILAGITFIFLTILSKIKLEGRSIPNLELSEKSGKVVIK